MSEVIQAFLNHDLMGLIKLVGMAGVVGMVFAESGLLIGFFLPGDSLLFTAGLLASPGFAFFSIWTLVISTWIAAVLGDNVGYEFGRRVGRKLFKRKKSFLFNPSNVIKAQEFYEKHGGKAIVIARFMPIVRTFAPIVAGIGKMDRKKFMFFNLLGGTIWTWGVSWAGYYLGSLIPDVDKYLLPIVLLIIVLSILPPVIHIYKENKKSWHEKILEIIRRFIKYKI
ncbi:DedA family protein [Patescibacteria group bacterium]